MPYRTIICPIDSSELSAVAEEAAAYVVKISGAKLVLLHVMQKWFQGSDVVTDSKEWTDIHQGWLDEGRELLVKEAANVKSLGVDNVEIMLRDGEAAYEIVAAAKERRADLIVMATYRHSPLGKLFTGSITDRVAKNTPCPILWCFKNKQ